MEKFNFMESFNDTTSRKSIKYIFEFLPYAQYYVMSSVLNIPFYS
jgi:hypothetical protein